MQGRNTSKAGTSSACGCCRAPLPVGPCSLRLPHAGLTSKTLRVRASLCDGIRHQGHHAYSTWHLTRLCIWIIGPSTRAVRNEGLRLSLSPRTVVCGLLIPPALRCTVIELVDVRGKERLANAPALLILQELTPCLSRTISLPAVNTRKNL